MDAHWGWRRLIAGLVTVLAAPVLSVILAAPAARAADTGPIPTVGISAPATPLIGQSVEVDLTFVNDSAIHTGYGPYVDLKLPLGMDGNDGLTFTGATYLGATVANVQLVADITGCVTHPWALDATDAHVQVCGMSPGQVFVALRLPFGSFTPGQPTATLKVATQLSSLADAGAPLTISAAAGFQFGADPLNDPTIDPSVIGAPASTTISPTIITVTKTYLGPEDETATGPNFPQKYTISAIVAPGQTVTNLTLIDDLPANMQFVSIDPTVPAGAASVSTPSTLTPGGTLSRNFGTVVGTGGASASMTFTFYIPRVDQSAAVILNANTGAFANSVDTARATAMWAPIDIRDATGPVSAGPVTHTLRDKSVAVQKSAGLAVDLTPAGASPGDTIQWTMAVQVSDYFALNTLVLDDLLGDGTRFDNTFTPTLQVDGNGFTSAEAPFAGANFTLSAVNGLGKTPISFRVSDELVTRGGPNGRLVGGCINPATGSNPPNCSAYNNLGTTVTITFRSIIQQTYVDGLTQVVEGDTLINETAVTGSVLNPTTAAFTATGSSIGDGSAAVATAGSAASVSIAKGGLQKTIFAINGNTTVPAQVHVAPGDRITYRLTQTFPTSRTDDFRIFDYLPLPIFAAGGVSTFDPLQPADDSIPAAGTAKYGPSDTFHSLANGPVPAPSPIVSTDGTANSVEFRYGDFALYPPAASVADILFTVTVSTDPFADGLLLTNQARSQTRNSVGALSTADAIVQITLDQPVLTITKGVVRSSNTAGVLSPATAGPVAFDAVAVPPAGTCPGWSGGPITSAGLSTNPIDSNLSAVDAGDLVRFAFTVENSGHSAAYEVKVADTLPSGLVVPAGGLKLCVANGAGTALAYTNVGTGTGLFDKGIQLTDPNLGADGSIAAGTSGGIANATGTNIAVVSYTLQVAGTAAPKQAILNTARLIDFTNEPGASGHLGVALTDDASVLIASPVADKTITATNQGHTTLPAVAVGEIVTYQVTLTIPEGTMPAAKLTDTLPAGLSFVGCDSITPSTLTDITTSLSGSADFSGACSAGVFPAGNPAVNGAVVTFSLGDVANANRDNAIPETITIVYRAVVSNDAVNVRGHSLPNSAVLSWTGGSLPAATAPAINVVEPIISSSKTVDDATPDAGDTVVYTVTISNPADLNGSPAFEASLADTFPSGMTYVPSSLEQVAGPAPDSVSDGGGTGLTATWAVLNEGDVATFHYSMTVDAAAVPSSQIHNHAVTTWTGLPGIVATPQSVFDPNSTERTGDTNDPGGDANTYRVDAQATSTVPPVALQKTIKATNLANTTLPAVAVGEIVTYEVTVTVPEGMAPNAKLTDTMPAGMAFLACDSITPSSTDLTTSLSGTSDFSDACSAGVFPAGNPTVNGRDVTFSLGDITNANRDNATPETIVLVYRAVVLNVAGNQRGTALPNAAVFTWTGGTSATASVTDLHVVEPGLTILKTASPATGVDANDQITYQLTIINTVNGNGADGFDARLTDVIPAGLTYVPGSLIALSGNDPVTLTTTTTNTANDTMNGAWDTFSQGEIAVLEFKATLDAADPAGTTYRNTAAITWTSLPGVVSSAQSAFNAASVERTGADGKGGLLNDYADNNFADVTLRLAGAAKTVSGHSLANTALPAVAVGEIVTYQVTITVPEGTMPAARVTDTLPAGMAFLACDSITPSSTDLTTSLSGTSNFSGACSAGVFPAGDPTVNGGVVTFNLGSISNANADNGTTETLVVQYRAVVLDTAGNQRGTTLRNSAVIAWTGHTLPPVWPVTDLHVVEPGLSIVKTASPASGVDAGDEIVYRLTVANAVNANGADAFDVSIVDPIPAGLTYVPGSLIKISGADAETRTTSQTLKANDTMNVTWATFSQGQTAVIEFRATLDANVPSGHTYRNTAIMTWTSLPGVVTSAQSTFNAASVERTGADGKGGALNDYADNSFADVTVTQPLPVKTIAATSETRTTGSYVAIGEIVRFRVVVTVPEGVTPAVSIRDTLPAGLRYLNDGSARVALLSNGAGAGLTSDTLSTPATCVADGLCVVGDSTWAGLPTYAVPTGSVTGGTGGAGAFIDGDDPTFPLGKLTNADSDPNLEAAVIEFNVLVDNVIGNQAGTNRADTASIRSGATNLATSNPATSVTVAEPIVTFTKTVTATPIDAGDPTTYRLTVANSGTANSPAFDVRVLDPISTNLAVPGAATVSTIAGSGCGYTDNSSGRSIDITLTEVDAGTTCAIDITTAPNALDAAGLSIDNQATATWTSLPGAGTATGPNNSTGSATPGASGQPTGERNGADGVAGVLNDYAATSVKQTVTLAVPSVAKYGPSPASAAIGATTTFDVVVTLPEGTSRNLKVFDTLPAGMIADSFAVVTDAASSGGRLAASFNGTVTLAPTSTPPAGSGGGTWTLVFGDTVAAADNVANNNAFLVRITGRIANVVANQSLATLSNGAYIQYDTTATQRADAVAHPSVVVIEPVLAVSKNASTTSPQFGDTVTYTVAIVHAGASNAPAYDLTLTDPLPAGTSYVANSLQTTAGQAPTTAGEGGGVITLTFDSFALGATSTITYQATVTDAIPGHDLVNTAVLKWTSVAGASIFERTGSALDPGGALNVYTASAQVTATIGGVDMSISKTDNQTEATAGVLRIYTITYTNDGNQPATGVTVRETVPVGAKFTAASSTAGWSCPNGSVAGTVCTHAAGSGTVAGGGSGTVDFAVTVVDPIPTAVTKIDNTATVADDGSNNDDPTPDDNTATDSDTIPKVDVSLTKSVNIPRPGRDEKVVFTLTASNDGPSDATGVQVVDHVPAALTYLSSTAAPGTTYDPASGLWNIGALADGESATLTITVQVTSNASVVNAAEVTHCDQVDIDSTPGNGANAEDDYATAVINPTVADLGVAKSVLPLHPDVGARVTFTVVAHNYGPDDATGVVVADALPVGLDFVSADPSVGTYDSGAWTIGNLDNGQSATLTLIATVSASGSLTNTAAISGDPFDPNPANNTASAAVDQLVDLVVTKTVNDPSPNVGATATFTVTVTNAGPGTAHNVVLHDAQPVGLTFVSTDQSQGSYSDVSHDWTVGTIDPGNSATLTVYATVNGAAAMTNTATVTHVDEPQTDITNDTASATVTPPHADLAVVKTVNVVRPDLNDTDFFTVTLTNNGPDTATHVELTDLLPAGLGFASYTASQGTYDDTTGVWTVGQLLDKASATLTIHVTVNERNDFTNTATVTKSDQYDPNPDNDTDSASLSTRVADIGVTKTVDNATPNVGTLVTFTMTATNNGLDGATQIVIHDSLPAGLTYDSHTVDAGTYDPITGNWSIASLALDAQATLTITARVVDSGAIHNTVTVASLLQRDNNPDNNTATATVTAPPAADLSLTKVADNDSPDKGTNVTFTLTVTNHGPDGTDAIVVHDSLPPNLTYISDTGSGSYDPATGDWDVGALGVGNHATLAITASVDAEGPIVNVAEIIHAGLFDPDSTPNNHVASEDDQASAALNARGVADLSLAKHANQTRVVIGSPLTYTLVVTNHGPDPATGVVVRDQLPVGVVFVSSAGGAYNHTTGAWTVGSLSVGTSATLTITVRVGQAGAIVNVAEVVAENQHDPNSTPNNGVASENDEASAGIASSHATPPPTVVAAPDRPAASTGWVTLLASVFALLVAGLFLIVASRRYAPATVRRRRRRK
jgi:uncharacterized repeat protein (TIGR01451 family)/fimbrial isopeptide formation D2 family protein